MTEPLASEAFDLPCMGHQNRAKPNIFVLPRDRRVGQRHVVLLLSKKD
jgi:hypothetical protein